jgi:hypothetical protein
MSPPSINSKVFNRASRMLFQKEQTVAADYGGFLIAKLSGGSVVFSLSVPGTV